MSLSVFWLITVLSFFTHGVLSFQENYYWREYTGEIPSDAVVGGEDINGKNVYIGQVYHALGLIVVQIYEGEREVAVPISLKVKKQRNFIKILCGPKGNFYWLPANASSLHLTLRDKHAVIGGHIVWSDGWGLINIGRITQNDETKIGRILSYDVGEAYFFYNNNGHEGTKIKSYEVLIYKDVPTVY